MDLNQVTIDVADLARAAAFYERLGLKRIVWSPPRYARYECPSGASTISLHIADGPVASGVSLYFEVDDVDLEVERLLALGIGFDALPKDQEWRWREAWTCDPDGHRVCVFHAGLDRRFPPWRVAADDGAKR
ncbi:MAG: VOC family protein [Alphaproteobacteria bacterium]|nr:VOC family protein [Alphaproteobacteria bacterium]